LNKDEDLSILDMKAEWKLKGDKDWSGVEFFESAYGNSFSCEPLQPNKVYLTIVVKDQEKEDRSIRMFDRSWIARLKPIRFKITFEDVIGRKGYQVVEFVNPPPYIPKNNYNYKIWAYVDDPEYMSRETMYVNDGNLENNIVFSLNGTDYSINDITGIVFKALNDKNFEYPLKLGDNDSSSKWDAYALIDPACLRVYAVKVLIQNKFAASLVYYEVPLYSPSNDKADPENVSEQVSLPERSLFSLGDVEDYDVGEDGLGTEKVETHILGTGAVGGSGNVSFEALVPVLSSLDFNMKRIADSLERIVSALESKR
jgi:hypothetical protein